MPNDESKTWAIGVDLAEHHLGPPRFVAAMLAAVPRDTAVGLHVMLDPEFFEPLIEGNELRSLRQRIATDVEQSLAQAGLERASVQLIEEGDVDRGLADGVTRLHVDVLVIGRRAKRDEDSFVRLGEVTRRLLRRLPAPLVVVPPDFGEPSDRGFGEGPIVVGVDLGQDCTAAVLFAADLAARLGRSLLLAHGIQAFHWGASYVAAETIERVRTQAREKAAAALREWAAPLGLGDVRQQVFVGDPAKQLLQLATDEDATMLVTGSRMLGPIERLFLASVSTEVAAGARCPVAVVPCE
jgi:nucleotide-binding universal stress UspA family protein